MLPRCVAAEQAVAKVGLDDVISAIAVHGASGFASTVALGLVATNGAATPWVRDAREVARRDRAESSHSSSPGIPTRTLLKRETLESLER